MANANVDAVRRWFEEVWNEGRLDLARELLAPKVHVQEMGVGAGVTEDPEELVASVRALRNAVPDIRFEILDTLSEGDRVAARLRVTGTHTGAGLPIEPQGRRFTITGAVIARYQNGRLVEGWNHFDLLSLYEQLGALKRP